MIILSIDPGSSESAWLHYESGKPKAFGKDDNWVLLGRVMQWSGRLGSHLAIEYMYPRGMPTSKEEMETQFWAGRFVQAWGGDWSKVYRKDVKMHLCNSMRAKDSNIRQALIDKWGGKEKAIGRKLNPGPLFGIKHDLWSALAIAVTYSETQKATRK